jgi:hypothetical protein
MRYRFRLWRLMLAVWLAKRKLDSETLYLAELKWEWGHMKYYMDGEEQERFCRGIRHQEGVILDAARRKAKAEDDLVCLRGGGHD